MPSPRSLRVRLNWVVTLTAASTRNTQQRPQSCQLEDINIARG